MGGASWWVGLADQGWSLRGVLYYMHGGHPLKKKLGGEEEKEEKKIRDRKNRSRW